MAKAEKSTDNTNNIIRRSEIERLKQDVYRPGMEKFRLFTQMLRTNALLKKAVIRHK